MRKGLSKYMAPRECCTAIMFGDVGTGSPNWLAALQSCRAARAWQGLQELCSIQQGGCIGRKGISTCC